MVAPALHGAGGPGPSPRSLLSRFLQQVPSTRAAPAPQAVPEAGPGGPEIDLSALGDAVTLEQRLRTLLKESDGALKLNVPGGRARQGDFSVGSSETITGHLLVLQGQVDLFGKVTGNVVALDGDIVTHRGAVIDGDALALGGRIQDRGGAIRGDQRALGATPTRPAVRRGPMEAALLGTAGLAGVLLTLLA
jgi:hypothetical protein